jgi:cytochrome P450
VLIVNTYSHRDPELHEYADRFAPEAWISGDAAGDWTFNHFSHGPQGCPGTAVAKFVGKAMVAKIIRERDVTLTSGGLEPGELPHMLDYFGLKLRLSPRS